MKRYEDCIMTDSECRKCSLSSYERDCHGAPAQKLSYAMRSAGKTQKMLEADTGIAQQSISKWVTGERDFGAATARTATKVARALNTTVENLIDEI